MFVDNSKPNETDPNVCIWKPVVKKTVDGNSQILKFPYRILLLVFFAQKLTLVQMLK